MFNRECVLIYLRKHQTEHRFKHTLGTEQCAKRLASYYNIDKEKAQNAALLHDCAKWMDSSSMIKNALEYGLELDEVYRDNPDLAHGWAGANIAEKEFGVDDKDILEAICYHTIPCLEMSDLSKLIYVADFIEETRKHSEARIIRGMIDRGLEEVFQMVLKSVIMYQIEFDKPLHVDSVHTYNHIIINK